MPHTIVNTHLFREGFVEAIDRESQDIDGDEVS